MQSFNTVIPVSANGVSAGQRVIFSGVSVSDVVITNNSGYSIQYSMGGGIFNTVANAATASVGDVDPATFVIRKAALDASPGAPVSVGVSWKASDDSVAQSRTAIVRAAIAAAARSNSVINTPWSKAPTHAFSTPYTAGGCVRGQGANAENLYLCVQAGTSGAASAPSGTGAGGITDGTCAWLYIGKGNATSTYPFLSTVTPTSASDVMNGLVAFPNVGTASTLGLSNQYVMNYANTPARVSGGNALINDSGYIDIQGPITGTLASGTRSGVVRKHLIHFLTDARGWLYIQQSGPLYSGTKRYIEIDGRSITEGDIGIGTTVNPGGVLIDMSRFGPGVHEVKIRNTNRPLDSAFYLNVQADEQIWPAPAVGPVIAFEGDSITQGSGTTAYAAGWSLNRLVGEQIGSSSEYLNAIGGTGVIANNSNNSTTYIERLGDIAAIQPDILVIGGFHNDGSSTSAARRTAILAYLQAVRAACPNATVFLTGNQCLAGDSLVAGSGSNQYDIEVDALAAYTAWGDANSKFIPLLTAAQKFPASTGNNTWLYQSAGSAPFNDSHPVPRYYPSIAGRIVQAIREFYA